MNTKEQYWYDLGYEDQCSRYPLLDHVWGYKKYFWQKAKYPKKYQIFYNMGQWQAYLDCKAEMPWFMITDYKRFEK
jgi:hypothetical protein